MRHWVVLAALLFHHSPAQAEILGDGICLPLREAPVAGVISSDYGVPRRITDTHQGIDIFAPLGTPIRAVQSGVVTKAKMLPAYGNTVVIDHGKKWTTLHAHMMQLRVREGDLVRRGQVIGFLGQTGNATGPHLHLEVRHRGRPKDPFAGSSRCPHVYATNYSPILSR